MEGFSLAQAGNQVETWEDLAFSNWRYQLKWTRLVQSSHLSLGHCGRAYEERVPLKTPTGRGPNGGLDKRKTRQRSQPNGVHWCPLKAQSQYTQAREDINLGCTQGSGINLLKGRSHSWSFKSIFQLELFFFFFFLIILKINTKLGPWPLNHKRPFRDMQERHSSTYPLFYGELWGEALLTSGTMVLAVCLIKPWGPFSSQLCKKPQTHLDSRLELILHYY